MPIYEYACPKCRTIFNLLSRRILPEQPPSCPKCGGRNMTREISRFAAPRAVPDGGEEPAPTMPDESDPRIASAMADIERDMKHMDEDNPRHMAHMMRKLKDLLPPGTTPKELDIALQRLASGEDPDKIEEDMGELLDGLESNPRGNARRGRNATTKAFRRDPKLYDYQ